MRLPAALVADLQKLTEALDPTEIELANLFGALIQALEEAVDSYLGLSITMVTGGRPISMTTLDDSIAVSDIATTATLALGSLIVVEPGSVIVVHAARAGAFTDLAADLTHALALRPQDLVLDDFPAQRDEPARLRHQLHLNQGVGILIERGQLPDDAHAELRRRADRAALTTEAVALQLIAESARLAEDT